EAMKARWYQATGMATLHRSRHSSLMADTMAYLRVLRSGQILAVTPDVIYPEGKGVAVEMFGRSVVLSPGLVVLAMRSGAPIVCVWGEWVTGKSRSEDRMRAIFDEPIEVAKTGDRDAVIRETLQRWCRRCEEHLRRQPQNWMFWLDKRWTKALRSG